MSGLSELINRRPEVGKWSIRWRCGADYPFNSGWYTVEFGVFKTTSLPPDGKRFKRKNFKGFVFEMSVFIPVRIRRW